MSVGELGLGCGITRSRAGATRVIAAVSLGRDHARIFAVVIHTERVHQ